MMEVGSGSAVDNGAMNDTVIGRGTKVDNLVHLGHNVEIGEDCFIIAQVGIAGARRLVIPAYWQDRQESRDM